MDNELENESPPPLPPLPPGTADSAWTVDVVAVVVMLQSLLRGNRERRRYLKLVARGRVARELLTTEQTYVGGLELMIRLYIKPLTESSKSKEPIISRSKIQAIFSVVEVMTSLNSVLLQDIEKRVTSWNCDSLLGDLFLTMGDYLKVATQYVNNYENAIKTVSAELKTNPAFKAFYDKTQANPESKKNDLKSFLILPVQRIPRYEMLLKELIKKTPTDHPDYVPLKQAYEKIKGISGLIDNRKDVNVKQQEVLRIQSLCEPKVPNLVQPTRRLVFQLQLKRHEVTSTFHEVTSTFRSLGGLLRTSSLNNSEPVIQLFLFDDVLLICEAVRFAGAPPPEAHQYVPVEPLIPLYLVSAALGKDIMTLTWTQVTGPGRHEKASLTLAAPEKEHELVREFVKKSSKLSQVLRTKMPSSPQLPGLELRKEDEKKSPRTFWKSSSSVTITSPTPVSSEGVTPEKKRELISSIEEMLATTKAVLQDARDGVGDELKAKIPVLEASLEQHRKELAQMLGFSGGGGGGAPSSDPTRLSLGGAAAHLGATSPQNSPKGPPPPPPPPAPTTAAATPTSLRLRASGTVAMGAPAGNSTSDGGPPRPVKKGTSKTVGAAGADSYGQCAFCKGDFSQKEAAEAVEYNGVLLHSRCVSGYRKAKRGDSGLARSSGAAGDTSLAILSRRSNNPTPPTTVVSPHLPSLPPPAVEAATPAPPPSIATPRQEKVDAGAPSSPPPSIFTPPPPSLVTPSFRPRAGLTK